MGDSKKQKVLKILKDEPRGLTVQEISRRGKMSRFNATIFAHELLGEGKITTRKIGAYKLFKIKSR